MNTTIFGSHVEKEYKYKYIWVNKEGWIQIRIYSGWQKKLYKYKKYIGTSIRNMNRNTNIFHTLSRHPLNSTIWLSLGMPNSASPMTGNEQH